MSYTNGFNAGLVLPKLMGRLGWKDASLSAANRESKSGRYFDDGSFHALVTVPNIEATQPITDKDAHFEALQKAAIHRCLSAVFNEAAYIDNRVVLYERLSNKEILRENQNRFCGLEIRVAPSKDIAVQIDSVSLYFDTDHTFPLYLFRSGNAAPVKEVSVDVVGKEATEITLDEWILKYPGIYYLGYFQSDLGIVKAIGEDVHFNRTHAFAAQAITAVETEADFDRNAINYTGEANGINMQVSSFTDFTDHIMRQAFLFDEALGLVMANMVMEGEFFSTLSNGAERTIKDSAKAAVHLELQGALPIPDSPHIEGLRSRINKELKYIKGHFFKQGQSRTVNLC